MDTKTAKTEAAAASPVIATIGHARTPSEFVGMIDRFMPPREKGPEGEVDEGKFTWEDRYGYTWTVTVSNK